MTSRLFRSTRRASSALLRRLGVLLVAGVMTATLAAPSAAFAASAPGAAPVVLPYAPNTAASVSNASLMDVRAASYLDQLLSEINARRARAGNGPVVFAQPTANVAVTQYLTDLTPQMVARHACFHGNGQPVSPGWDYVKVSGFAGQASGEVLACPGDNGYWTAPKIADGWWNSPSHWQALYGDPRVNTVACGTYGPQNGGRAYQTIACVTYRV
jgi:uncharacterized protein YkwD